MNHSTSRPCKICSKPADIPFEVKGIPYYHCKQCNFLQNYYCEDEPETQNLTKANDERRAKCWQDDARGNEQMREKGWEMLQIMAWPMARLSRKLNTALFAVPGYKSLMKFWVKRNLHKLLDFGCGYGITVTELRDKDGFEIVGLDPYSPNEDPSIIRKTLQEAAFETNSLDGIFSIETLEHIPNVIEEFKELHRILKPNGVLLIQTRRLEDPDFASQGKDWFYLEDPQTHVSIYSEPALRRIAKAAGFKSVSFRGVKFARFVK